MTGTGSRTHGDRTFNEFLKMPDVPTLPEVFNNNGYQTYAVGKLHVYPQRARIGFDDVILNEEGRKVNFPHEMRRMIIPVLSTERDMQDWILPMACQTTII